MDDRTKKPEAEAERWRSAQHNVIWEIGMISYELAVKETLVNIMTTSDDMSKAATEDERGELEERARDKSRDIKERFGTALHIALDMAEDAGRRAAMDEAGGAR